MFEHVQKPNFVIVLTARSVYLQDQLAAVYVPAWCVHIFEGEHMPINDHPSENSVFRHVCYLDS